MTFNDDEYQNVLNLAKLPPRDIKDQVIVLAHERVLTLEAEIKVLVDAAGKDRAKIERIKEESKANYDAADRWEECALKRQDITDDIEDERDRLREELKLSEGKHAELVLAVESFLVKTPNSFSNCTEDNYEKVKSELRKALAFHLIWMRSRK